MSKVIRISESIFRRLQGLAVPLEDTPASVIERLLDFYDSHENGGYQEADHTIARTEAVGRPNETMDILSRAPRQRGVMVEIGGQLFSADSLADLYDQVLRFLADNNYLEKLVQHLPVATSAKRYLIAVEPFHPNGKAFVRPVEHQGYFMEAHKDYKNGINHLRKILDLCGLSLRYIR